MAVDAERIEVRRGLRPPDGVAAVPVGGCAGAAANWNSGNAVWRTQTSTNLDPFCINCHDSDGAPQMPGAKQPTCTAPGTVVDVKSMVTGSPPPKGTFSRHAIRGQSTSIYTKYTALGGTYRSMYEGPAAGQGRFTSMGTDENGKPNWNDTSVMGCADCHTSDGANGAAGNAHGSGSEYLLKDSSGGAAEGTLAALNYVCYRCHFNNTTNNYYSGGSPHTGNGGDWVDYTGQVGTGRVPFGNTGGNWQATACGNCHGATAFGGIHGTSEMVPVTTSTTSGATVNCGTTPGACRNAYRFTNGASMRYYDPLGWTGTQSQCYTLSTGEA